MVVRCPHGFSQSTDSGPYLRLERAPDTTLGRTTSLQNLLASARHPTATAFFKVSCAATNSAGSPSRITRCQISKLINRQILFP